LWAAATTLLLLMMHVAPPPDFTQALMALPSAAAALLPSLTMALMQLAAWSIARPCWASRMSVAGTPAAMSLVSLPISPPFCSAGGER
jgi:hypothetical protein